VVEGFIFEKENRRGFLLEKDIERGVLNIKGKGQGGFGKNATFFLLPPRETEEGARRRWRPGHQRFRWPWDSAAAREEGKKGEGDARRRGDSGRRRRVELRVAAALQGRGGG
jgi:hypothetical protein